MAKRPSTWIVVADGARARFFAPSEDARKLVPVGSADLVAPQSRQHARERREFDQLILVAPRRSLGELRTLISKRVQRSVRQEIAKDLTAETPASLWKHLATLVRPNL